MFELARIWHHDCPWFAEAVIDVSIQAKQVLAATFEKALVARPQRLTLQTPVRCSEVPPSVVPIPV